ncbi:hypothetical protein [Thermovibrio sp.]
MIKELNQLNEKRKNREITAREYYRGLIDVLSELIESLREEEISEEEVRKQIPLLRIFLTEQLKKMADRGH